MSLARRVDRRVVGSDRADPETQLRTRDDLSRADVSYTQRLPESVQYSSLRSFDSEPISGPFGI